MVGDAITPTLGALAEASERARSLEAEIRTLAAQAAAEGASYGDIGRALGITRQGARKRFPRLLDARRATTTTPVASEPVEAMGGPVSRSPSEGDPTAHHATTLVVDSAPEEGVVVEAGSTLGVAEAGPAQLPTEPVASTPKPGSATTMVVEPDPVEIGAGPPERTGARPGVSRPRQTRSPRARPRTPLSALDRAIATAAAATEHSRSTLERTDGGYRVIIDGVDCGRLRPVYRSAYTDRPSGWLPLAPGLTPVFPAGRSYRTRAEAVSHLVSDLRHRDTERRRNRRAGTHR
ncbi:hypothetical protein [Frankia sp. AgB32]|uniref:hypothetical protein n=1 Tax=Frankia sp. AgB32 TaxID=631119 RepID=UPI00200EB5BB|nr:hypothetical protein [Frankia sp. AgB32]MCK9898426.1 hypothetical protein [Frankia sp. AgB32]